MTSRRMTSVLSPAVSSFRDLVEHGQFVDKTLALRDFLAGNVRPVHLLLRPRRSGKTTLLRMFRDFFQVAGDDAARDGRKKLFVANGLDITREEAFDEFGKYPVLYVDFSDVTGVNMEEMLDQFKDRVVDLTEQLIEGGLFPDLNDLGEMQRQFLNRVRASNLTNAGWSSVVFKLTRLLHTVSGEKVIVLIDEYDTPVSNALQHGYLEQANQFFRHFFTTLIKNNENLRGALLVGILQAAKADWFGMNNLNVYPPSDDSKYSTACMFTDEEMRHLYEVQKKRMKDVGKDICFTFEDLEKWYNGYSTPDGRRLYNPWSVGEALTRNKLAPSWVQSG